ARLVTGQAKDATGNAEGSLWQGVALTWRKEARARGAVNTGLQKRDHSKQTITRSGVINATSGPPLAASVNLAASARPLSDACQYRSAPHPAPWHVPWTP